MNHLIQLTCGLLAMAMAVQAAPSDPVSPTVTQEKVPVKIYTLRNTHGCEVRITNYGGIILSLLVPDRHGKLADIVLGFDRPEDYRTLEYLKRGPYFGALIGRYANRIAGGKFSLDGREYLLSANEGANTLHGGARGFDKRVWDEVAFNPSPDGGSLVLRYVSPDGEEGFPGTLTTQITYALSDANVLDLTMEATTDKDTVVNLTQHTYFNLKGADQGDILGHEVTLHADQFVPIDTKSLPLGGVRPVAGTPFDLTRPTVIGTRIGVDDEQLRHGQGFDHAFVLDGYHPGATVPQMFARVVEPTTGRVLEIAGTQPGVQFYTGNQLDGTFTGKAGRRYEKHDGFCLEPGCYPDSPHHPEFPTAVLKSGETYRQVISYRFSVVP